LYPAQGGHRDPWAVGENEQHFRASVAAHLAGQEDELGLALSAQVPLSFVACIAVRCHRRRVSVLTFPHNPWQRMPEFASRLNLPAGGLGKTQIKLLFGSEQAYETYAEALRLVDGVQQRDAVAGKFRHQLYEHFPHLDRSVADEIFDAELEEFSLKREVARVHLGHTRAERIAVQSVDERFAMLAAGSIQPVISSLIQAALKKRAAPRAGMSALEAMHKSVDKRLSRPTGAQERDRCLVEEGLEALEDRAKAMLSLCENLRAELQERIKGGGAAPDLQQHLDTLRARNERLRFITRGGTEIYHAIALLQSAARGLCMREEEERRLQAEDEAFVSRIKACCRRVVRQKIFLCARQLPRFARRGMARADHIAAVGSGEVLKMGAKRRRWMIRLAKLVEGYTWKALEEMEAADREDQARMEKEDAEAEVLARCQAMEVEQGRQAAAAAAAGHAAAALKSLETVLRELEKEEVEMARWVWFLFFCVGVGVGMHTHTRTRTHTHILKHSLTHTYSNTHSHTHT
jgi:hypothetical protein